DGPAGLVPGHRGPSASLVPTGAQFRLRVLKPLARVSLAGLEAVAVGGAVVLVRLSLPAIAPGTEVVAEPGVFRGRVDQFADALPGESARDRPADDSADQRADRSAGAPDRQASPHAAECSANAHLNRVSARGVGQRVRVSRALRGQVHDLLLVFLGWLLSNSHDMPPLGRKGRPPGANPRAV